MLFIDSVCTVIYCSVAFTQRIVEGGGTRGKEKENLSCSSLACLDGKVSLICLQRKQRPPAEGSFQEWSGGWLGEKALSKVLG